MSVWSSVHARTVTFDDAGQPLHTPHASWLILHCLAHSGASRIRPGCPRFVEGAVFIDPHYPQPRMVGLAAIERGARWALGNIAQLGFTLHHLWIDGESGAVEADTHHVFRDGLDVTFAQVFVFETCNGKLTRVQAYLPYGPHGLAAALATITRWVWRMQGKVS